MTQPRLMSATVTKAMPVLETANSEIVAESLEISAPKAAPRAHVEKTLQPFEEIPGPAILKFWEKYWRYVPLLGTQLFCSLLNNRFTQGTKFILLDIQRVVSYIFNIDLIKNLHILKIFMNSDKKYIYC